MGNIDSLTGKLTAIGNAIREKTGKSDLLTLDQMPTEIQSIKGSLPDNKKIIFKKYDGSVVASYTVEEALNLEALPELPSAYPFSEDALRADEWIYTLNTLKQMLTDDYYINKGIILYPLYKYVGTYTDAYFIKIDNPDQCTFYFYMGNNYSEGFIETSIDFGDGSIEKLTTYGQKDVTHTYKPETYPAYYTIKFKYAEKTYSGITYKASSYFDLDKTVKYPCHKAIIGNNGTNLFKPRILHDGYKFLIQGDTGIYSTIHLKADSNLLESYGNSDIIELYYYSTDYDYNIRKKDYYIAKGASYTEVDKISSYNIFGSLSSGVKTYYATEDEKEIFFPSKRVPFTEIGSIISLNNNRLYNRIIHFPPKLNKLNRFPQCFAYSIFDFSKCEQVPTLTNMGTSSSTELSNIRENRPTIIVPDSLYDSWKTATNWSVLSVFIKKASEVSL